jgi:ribose transport system permease protein
VTARPRPAPLLASAGRLASRPEIFLPAVSLLVVLAAFGCTPLVSGSGLTTFDIFNTLQGLAQLGLLALGLGITMIAGEFDLSVAGTYAAGGMIAVQAGQSSPVLGMLAAVAAGAAIRRPAGRLIAALRIPSLPVTLATYIALLGLTSAMSGGLSVTYANASVTLALDRSVAAVFSAPSLITLAAFAVAALVLGRTRLGRQVRAIGGDRRASRVAGVRVGRTLGLFTVSGTLAALGGALQSYSYASANPDPGLRPLILAAVACLAGGVSLAGGVPAGGRCSCARLDLQPTSYRRWVGGEVSEAGDGRLRAAFIRMAGRKLEGKAGPTRWGAVPGPAGWRAGRGLRTRRSPGR